MFSFITKTRKKQQPRPLYVIHKGEAEIVGASRNAAEVLKLIDADRDLQYSRIEAS